MALKVEVKAEVVRQLAEAVSILSDDVKLNFQENDLECIVVDPSHVAMVHINIDKDAFETYESSGMEIGVDMKKIRDFIGLIRSTDMVDMEIEEDSNKMVMKVGDVTSSMALVDHASMPESKVPSLSHPAKVSIKTSELTLGIKVAEKITENITLVLQPDKFSLHAKGDLDAADLDIPKDRLVKVECKEEVKSKYNLDFLQRMIRVASNSEVVDMNLSNNYPLKLDFDIAGGKGHVSYLLAPRMDE